MERGSLKYKTKRQACIWVAVWILIACLCWFISIVYGRNRNEYFIPGIEYFILLFGIGVLTYFLTYDVKRNHFIKCGECIPGCITGAECEVNGRGEWTYYLLISFYDNGQKIKFTEGYVGDPNDKLKSCECNIYKWNGKYIEADLQPLEREQMPVKLNIPVNKYRGKNKNKKYV